jgi:hypothetical protein
MKRSVHREMRTIEAMIRIYCRHHHHQDLCPDCGTLFNYAIARIEKCIFGFSKPACNKCEVHCYSPRMKEKVKEVMRFSGPKMLYKHPVLAIAHILKEKRNKSISLNQT